MTLQAQPVAKKQPETFSEHGNTRTDNYFWMKNRDSREVLDYINEENTYSQAYFDKQKPLTDHLLDEFEKRIDPNETSAPFIVNGQTLQFKSVEGKNYRELYLESVLFFDENKRAEGKKFYQVGDFSFSTSNSVFAFSEDVVGRRKYTIRFMDVKTKKILSDEITNTDGSVVWANDNKTIYYIRKDEETLREFQVYRHTVGTSTKNDELVFQEDDEAYALYLTKTIDDKYVIINSGSTTTSESLLIEGSDPKGKPETMLGRTEGHLYEIDHTKNGFYVLTNFEAPNQRLVFSPTAFHSIKDGKTIVEHRKETYLEGFQALNDRVIISEKTKGIQELVYCDLNGTPQGKINFPESVYEIGMIGADSPEDKKIRYVYQSFTIPNSVFEFDFESKSTTTIHTKKLLDPNFKSSDYVSERIWIRANDGTEIPVSIVYKKGLNLKKAPLLLYGYGSYGVTIPCTFSATRFSLLDRGFVYAIAHIRGGKDLGEDWYQDGKLMRKRNTFTDFINSAEWLAMKGYCDPAKIYAQGGSAGGLLMGSVVNMAPNRFKGVVAQVPFVDVMNTMLDASLPLTVGEYEEWGNPNNEDAYWYMMSYSPYDNVQKTDYPSIYITTGYHDSQVQYWEPLKWIAKLRDNNTSNNPLLFHCTMEAGHGGGSGKSNQRLEVALVYTYLLSLEGIEK